MEVEQLNINICQKKCFVAIIGYGREQMAALINSSVGANVVLPV